MDDVAFINHAAELGGGELHLLDYAAHRARSASVALFRSGPLVGELESRNVRVTVVPGLQAVLDLKRSTGVAQGVLAMVSAVRGVRRLAGQLRGAKIAYANSQKAAVIGSVAAVVARRPLVWHLHDILTAPDFSRAARRAVIASTNRSAALVIANSEATAEAYRVVGGRRPVIVIPNGIDSARFGGQDRERNRARIVELWGAGDSVVVGLFGRICPWKGQEVAIQALAHVPKAHLLIVGGPLFGQEAFEAELRDLAEAVGVADRVHWLGFRRDLPELMSGLDAVLHCSTEAEPFGRVIVEALMAGTPVIATRGGGASEIMQAVGADSLVEPRDPAELAAAIHRLLERPREAQRAEASRLRDRAIALFDLPSVHARLDQALAELGR